MLSSLSLDARDKCNYDLDVPVVCKSLYIAKLVNDAYLLGSILVLDYYQYFIEMYVDESCFKQNVDSSTHEWYKNR